MANNFFYSAYSYLDEWMQKDSGFHQVLAFERRDETPVAAGTQCLVEVAKYYGVIRTLRKVEENPRLKSAYDALQKMEPPDDIDVVESVEALARTLGTTYGTIPLSAASKFLWMRFRNPVVIYDAVASHWLSENTDYNGDGYRNYYGVWRRKYSEFEGQIQEACTELANIKKFTLAYQESDEVFLDWTNSRWFMERVYDHFMQNSVISIG